MKLSVGPVQYYWPRADLLQFYADLCQSPADTLYLGEVVCGKRHELTPAQWIDLARELANNCDKNLVLSTLVLIESGADQNAVRKLCDNEGLLVEANDFSAIQMLSERKLPFVAGPAINVYNAQSLQYLMQLGLQRWVTPVELSQRQLQALLSQLPEPPEVELLAWGRLPLAYSARCFTARHHQQQKDNCQYLCKQYPAGLPLKSQESQSLFTINGIATLSGETVSLLPHLAQIQATGVSYLRISPEWNQTLEVLNAFEAALRDEPHGMPATGTDGYWRGLPGMDVIARG